MKKDAVRTGGVLLSVFFLLFLVFGFVQAESSSDHAGAQEEPSWIPPPCELYTEEQPPFNYINEQGEVSGRSTEVVREIMMRIGADYPIYLRQWTDAYCTVQNRTDTAIFSTIRTHERDRMFKWVGPVAELQYMFYARSDDPVSITRVQDLRNHGLVAVVRNDAREQYLRNLNMTNILSLDDDAACMQALSSGEAEFWLGTKDIASQHAKKQDTTLHEFRPLDLPEISHQLYIAFNRKTSDQIVRMWQQALDEIYRDGTYDRIQSRYMPYICSWVRCIP